MSLVVPDSMKSAYRETGMSFYCLTTWLSTIVSVGVDSGRNSDGLENDTDSVSSRNEIVLLSRF